MKFYQIVLVITFIVAIINNSMSFADITFHSVSLLLMLYITSHYSFFKHFGKYVVLLTFWISLMFMPAFHLVKNLAGEDGIRGYIITPIDYERILSFGSKVLLISSLSWLFFSVLYRKITNRVYIYTPVCFSEKKVKLVFVFMFGLSLFSLAFGISRMGAQGVELPFHLAGIITLIRITLFPLFFAIIVENYYLCHRRIPSYFFILLFIWALLEVFVRLSKSALVVTLLPVVIVFYIYYRPSLRKLVKYVVPVFALFIFLYPIVEAMRSADEGSLVRNYAAASKSVVSDDRFENPLLQPLNRTFMIPSYYAKNYFYVNSDKLFDFSKAQSIIAWGGAARYQTFVIDGYPLGIAHSSGTTGLEDPLLHGGYGLCYIIIILLMLMAKAIDSLSYKRMYSIYVALVLLLFSFCNSQNITSLYDSVNMQYILARFVAIWIAFMMNFRRKIITN